MALKKQLTKAEFDNLPESFKTEYKASGENFVLDIEGDDGVDWKRKRDIAEEHRKKAEQRAEAAEEERDNLRRGAIPKDDVEALETSWKTKLTAAEQKHADELAARDAVIANTTITAVASEVSSIFMAPAAMVPMIRSRLKSEIVNGVATTRVLDKNGQPSALTIDDLKNEYKADASLAPVLVGSKGSGGGGGNGGNGGGADKKLKDMNDKERSDFFRNDPVGFRAAVAAQK